LQIFPNLVANDYKSHVVVNGMVTFWLISTSDGCNQLIVATKRLCFDSHKHYIHI